MTREYEQQRRTKQIEDTRRRIIEATIELHGELGPARTTISAIAERAGVQRQTYYRHFPDERSLRLACSGLYSERNPMPKPESWRAIANPNKRLLHGLEELYAYYGATENHLTSVIRDAQIDPLTRETVALRMAAMAELRDALTEGLTQSQSSPHVSAVIDLALDFNTWRVLVRRNGFSPAQAAKIAARIIRCSR